MTTENYDAKASLHDEVRRLTAWKREASEVILDLQDLGKALGLPLGAQITGPKAVEKAQGLVAENQRLRDTIQAVEKLRDEDWTAQWSTGPTYQGRATIREHLNRALGVSGE